MAGVDGRVALVTGGAGGIGAAIAKRFAADGAKVAVLDLNGPAVQATADEIGAYGGVAVGIPADVTDRVEVDAAIAQVVSEFGALDVLVNNAGVLRDNLLFRMTDDEWDAVIDIHLKGAFLCTRAAQTHMVEARFGRIITMSSTSALGNRAQINYSAAKAGLQGFTRTLAMELGPFGVTANAIAPGFIESAMTRSVAERYGIDFNAMLESEGTAVPVQRTGVPDDIANAAAFLAGDESGFITGQTLYVDGGRSLPST
jgi:3-oxoacyl-[acyl-carrier protein] reductase